MKTRLQWDCAALLGGAAVQLAAALLTEGWVLWTGCAPPPALELPDSAAEWAWKILLLTVLVPLAEEGIFRGLMYKGLRRVLGVLWAGLAVTLLFAAAHRSVSGIPAYVLFGLCAWGIREKSGSLEPCVLFHGAYNACAITAVVLLQ